jgi:hypothetical protein
MTIISTMTRKDADKTFTWRFVQTPEGYCAIGGNYKLVSYRSLSAMQKSMDWFATKGFALI